MVKVTICRLGALNISTRRAQSPVNEGSALRLSVMEPITFFSMDYDTGMLVMSARDIPVDEPNCICMVKLPSGK